MNPIRFVPFLLCAFGCGCASTITVDYDGKRGGIPYYLPKPFVLVTKNVSLYKGRSSTSTTVTKEGAKETTTTTSTHDKTLPPLPSEDVYTADLIYLPDYSRVARLNIDARFGSLETDIALRDGWRLDRVALKSDSQTDESIAAIADVVEAAAPAFTPLPGGGGTSFAQALAQALLAQVSAPDAADAMLRMLAPPPAAGRSSEIWLFEMGWDSTTETHVLKEVARHTL